MPAERYYYASPFSPQQTLVLEDKEFHHMIHVMRQREGEAIELINGKGALAEAVVGRIEKKRATIEIVSCYNEPPPSREIILLQAIPRMNRLETIVEKATELGATELCFFGGIRSERKSLMPAQMVRLEEQVIAAVKQCGRLWSPRLTLLPAIAKWKAPTYKGLFGDIGESAPALLTMVSQEAMAIVIGPEGGLDAEEISHLRRLGYSGVRLHSNILRTDTAAITALAQITALF